MREAINDDPNIISDPNRAPSGDSDMEVWRLVSPDRESLTKLFKSAFRKRSCREILSWRERLYLNALLKASWPRIRSILVLKILAPIVKKILKALGTAFKAPLRIECKDDVDEELVKGAIYIRCRSAYNIIKEAALRISRIAQEWGNTLAQMWPEDPKFIKYLMMMLNNRNYEAFTIRF